jgi:hypothetical protein
MIKLDIVKCICLPNIQNNDGTSQTAFTHWMESHNMSYKIIRVPGDNHPFDDFILQFDNPEDEVLFRLIGMQEWC